jgi:hypothetical protein
MTSEVRYGRGRFRFTRSLRTEIGGGSHPNNDLVYGWMALHDRGAATSSNLAFGDQVVENLPFETRDGGE